MDNMEEQERKKEIIDEILEQHIYEKHNHSSMADQNMEKRVHEKFKQKFTPSNFITSRKLPP